MTKRKEIRWLRGALGALLCLCLVSGVADRAWAQSDEAPRRLRIPVRMVADDSPAAGSGTVRVRSTSRSGSTFVIPIRPPRSVRATGDPGSPVTIDIGGSRSGDPGPAVEPAGRATTPAAGSATRGDRDDGSLFARLVGSGGSGDRADARGTDPSLPAGTSASSPSSRRAAPSPPPYRNPSIQVSSVAGDSSRPASPPARVSPDPAPRAGGSQPPRQATGFRSGASRPAAVADGHTYRLGPGDTVDVFVWRDPDLSRQVPVRPDGLVSLPLIGELQAAGRTPAELERVITERLGEYVQMPQVTVTVTQIRSLVVYVVGNVASPGPLTLDREVNVLQALAMAGGLNEFADDDEIVVLRTLADGTEQRLPFDYSDVVDGSRPEQNIRLRSGDIVYVP